MRRPSHAWSLILAASLVSCGPPLASQFIGQDGSRDWWTVQCGADEAACWRQAKAACHDSFDVHEIRGPGKATEPTSLRVRDGATPTGARVAGKEVVIRCTAPTVAPEAIAGPECQRSTPRFNHCDAADGETFTTGRTYLPRGARAPVDSAVDAKAAEGALAELRTLADGLGPEVDALTKPAEDVPALLKTLAELPRAYRLKAARLKALAKGALAGGATTSPRDIREEATDDVTALLTKLKATSAELRAMQTNVDTLTEKLSTLGARVQTLADKASAALGREAESAGPAEKARAKADLAKLPALKADVLQQLEELRTKLAPLPAEAQRALARLVAAAP